MLLVGGLLRRALEEAINPWRGSLLPLGCAAAPNYSPRSPSFFTTAAQPSGSKLPRHDVVHNKVDIQGAAEPASINPAGPSAGTSRCRS
ncbi:hypothetical protein EPZ47_10495 [Pseudomonas viciae]|uniref:Uncharacterized protein n=1 Tax=Pseudomonas viciae TaxID=2505979 RepID=A0A4P7PES1_9PSED|nr:hypothetical protein EPZ47_10495 [Pseudomonas viciae]